MRPRGVAALAGTGIGGLSYAVMTRNFDSISGYYLAEAKPGGGGGNVVNVILVDFRGFDTFGEIIVLGIAAVAIFALLDTALRGAAARRLAAMRHPEQARDAHPLLPVVATRVLLPIAITVAIYIFLRGHNAPGGGFIAGLVVAIALIMQYIASGYAWAATRARVDAQAMIGGGVAIAGLTGIAAWYFGRPFLTSAHGAFAHAVDRRYRVGLGDGVRSRRHADRHRRGAAVAAPDFAGRTARRARAGARGADGHPAARRPEPQSNAEAGQSASRPVAEPVERGDC